MHKRKSAILLLATATINTIAAVACTIDDEEKSLRQVKKKYKKRQYVLNTRMEIRQRLGYQNILAEMRLKDPHLFHNYLRMSAETFDKLLNIVGPSISKSVNGPRTPINPSTRLALSIRYL